MTRVVYVNGRYLPYAQAAVHAEDRGFQFADAVYEVCEVRDGRLVDETRHMQRLRRSLGELASPQPMARRRLVAGDARDHPAQPRARRPRLPAGVRAARGPREFLFPPTDVAPTVVCLARSVSPARLEAAAPRPASPSRPMPDTAGRAATSRR